MFFGLKNTTTITFGMFLIARICKEILTNRSLFLQNHPFQAFFVSKHVKNYIPVREDTHKKSFFFNGLGH